MPEQGGNAEVLKALDELHQYLSDQLAPLMVADSLQVLLQHPPELVASGIHSWVASLTRRDPSIPLADFLFHAVTKIYQMQEYRLISPQQFAPFGAGLKEAILKFCPEEDRDLLKRNLQLVGKVQSGNLGANIGLVYRPGGATMEKESAPAEPERQRETRRLGYLLNRLGQRLGLATAEPAKQEVLTETLADAARTASEPTELKQVMDRLQQMGIQAGPDDVFRALGQSLPGWSLAPKPGVQIPENSNLQAMRRIITKTSDVAEAVNHFRHLVKAAVERFNGGFLPQSASMFDLATKIVAAKEVDVKAIELQVSKAHENLSEEKLRKAAENPDLHVLLRKVLNFFPALTVEGLMEAVYDCPRRERRKLLLLLLEAHGEQARSGCLQYLRKPLEKNAPEIEVWYRRNLIYMLRRIPAAQAESLEMTVDALLPYARLDLIPMIVKETLAYLPQLRHEKIEQAMKKTLDQLEEMMADPTSTPLEPAEVLQLADRVVSCLCRLNTNSAHRAVLDHTLKKKADAVTLARLAEFGNCDLSDDEESLDRLLEALQGTLPLKRLGIVLPQKDYTARCIVQALAGTLHERARSALEELVDRYPESESGQAAAKALAKHEQAKTGKRPESPASLMGDLDLFGLPALLQNLADSTVTGTLSLKDPKKGDSFATVHLVKGRMGSCRTGSLTGDVAFFQLFEKPRPGTFQLVRGLEPTSGAEAGLPELLPLMLEGLRRYDEVQQMKALVPDDFRVKAKALKPSAMPGERDGLLFRDLWTAVLNGATPIECESTIALDCYRVRRLLAHWMESGIIEAI